MRIAVQKYGGSSVRDVAAIERVARRIADTREQGYQVVAVVSAMGGTTDELLALARSVSPDPPRRELDMLVTVGERISMALLSMAVQKLGYDAVSFTGSQSGIITNDNHFNARVIEVRPFRIQDELAKGRIVIVAGYQGVSYRREITTLGRGGSDATAVCLAAALSAEFCEICSDVDGVYTADPRRIPEARRLDEASTGEVLALARGGARVLHADALEYARQHGVAIYARATAQPPGEGGTIIRLDLDPHRPPVRGIAARSDLLYAQVPVERPTDALAALEPIARAGASLAEPPLHAWTQAAPPSAHAVFPLENAADEDAVATRVRDELGPHTSLRRAGAVTAAGAGLHARPDVWRLAARLLADAGIQPLAMWTGVDHLTALLEPEAVAEGERAWHQGLVENFLATSGRQTRSIEVRPGSGAGSES